MSIIQAVIASQAGGTPPPPPPQNIDAQFYSDTNYWYALNGTLGSGDQYYTNLVPYTYPDNTSGYVVEFDGINSYIVSPNLGIGNQTWATNAITIDFWFYPTAGGVQLLGEYGQSIVGGGYRYSMLEINNDLTITAMFWQGSVTTSSNTVTLNQWNHVYWAEDSQGGHIFSVNGIDTNGNPVYTRNGPGATSEYFAIGDSCLTNMGNTGRFQGKVGVLNIHDYVVPSTYTATKSRYAVLPTAYSLGSAATISGNNWNGSTIVGSFQTWPPGAPYAGTGVIMVNGAYLDMPVKLGYESWTIELVAELSPQTFWATIWGNESFTANKGYLAFFPSSAGQISIGSPNGNSTVSLTGITAGDRAMWTFVNNAGTVSLYRNGQLVGNATGATAPASVSTNSLYIGARHNNGGTGATDFCNLTLYYANVTDGALSPATIAANFDAIHATYGI